MARPIEPTEQSKPMSPVAFPTHTDDSGEVKTETDPIHTPCHRHRVQNCLWCRVTGGDGFLQTLYNNVPETE
jgi:hypothetical protein